MAYRGGGRGGRAGGDRDRGDHRPPFGHSGGGGGGRSGSFVWPPPATTPRPVPAQYPVRPMGFRAPMVLPHQVAYEPSVAVYRAPAPAPAKPSVFFSPAPPAAQDTIRAPPPAPSSSAPSPRQLVALASSSAPSAAALANEVEKKLFVSETALAPSAAAASAAVAAAQGAPASDAEGAADVDLAPVSKKGLGTVSSSVMIRANHVLVDVADNNLYHYDVS